jgi:hypothetical protein
MSILSLPLCFMSYHLHVDAVDLKDKSPLARHVLIKLLWLSMISVFLPAILKFEYGLSLTQIFLYEAVFSCIILFFSYYSSLSFTARHGTVASMFLGVCVFVLNFVVLYYAKQFPRLLLLSPLFSWIYVAYFWVGYHVAMALQSKNNKNFGAENSFLESVALIAWLIWPILWWLLADYYWSNMLYIATIVCLLLSCVPFFFHQKAHTPIRFHPRNSFALAKKDPWLFSAVLISFSAMWYVYFVWSVIWSILLYLFLWTYTKLAIVTFVSWIVLLLAFKLFGDQHDAGQWKMKQIVTRFMKRSFWSQSWTWLFAGLCIIWWILSQFLFIFVDTFHKITYRINELSLMTYFYETLGEEKNITNVLQLIFIREVAIHAARILTCMFLAWVTYVFQGNEYWALILSLFLVFLIAPFGSHLLIRKQRHASLDSTKEKVVIV